MMYLKNKTQKGNKMEKEVDSNVPQKRHLVSFLNYFGSSLKALRLNQILFHSPSLNMFINDNLFIEKCFSHFPLKFWLLNLKILLKKIWEKKTLLIDRNCTQIYCWIIVNCHNSQGYEILLHLKKIRNFHIFIFWPLIFHLN